jgi:hypothetical protein
LVDHIGDTAVWSIMPETRINPETGKLCRRDVRPSTITVGGISETIMLPGWYPDDDSESMHSGEDVKESDEVFHRLQYLWPKLAPMQKQAPRPDPPPEGEYE